MPGKQNKKTGPATLKARPAVTAAPGASTGMPGWAIYVVLVFTAFLYSRALNNGITYMDDDYYILNNPYLRDFSLKGIKAIFSHFHNYNYHPLTTLTNLL
jgi:hypothetical protein